MVQDENMDLPIKNNKSHAKSVQSTATAYCPLLYKLQWKYVVFFPHTHDLFVILGLTIELSFPQLLN